jgi:hypothetical protein
MHKKETRRFERSTEERYTFKGRYGAKGEKRAKKEKPTPEQIEYQNRKNKARRIRWLIKGNFTEDDLFVTLTYRAGSRKEIKEAVEDVRRLIRKLRRQFDRRGRPLKYIYAVEIGSRGGVHAHLIINECGETARLISKLWEHGHPNFKNLYEDGDYEQLAEYMAKVPPEKEGKTKMEQCAGKQEYCYNHSRNLVMVEPEIRNYSRRTVKKYIEALEAGATTHKDAKWIPEGFYVYRDSIRMGVNPYTGLSYLEYTLRPIKKRE